MISSLKRKKDKKLEKKQEASVVRREGGLLVLTDEATQEKNVTYTKQGKRSIQELKSLGRSSFLDEGREKKNVSEEFEGLDDLLDDIEDDDLTTSSSGDSEIDSSMNDAGRGTMESLEKLVEGYLYVKQQQSFKKRFNPSIVRWKKRYCTINFETRSLLIEKVDGAGRRTIELKSEDWAVRNMLNITKVNESNENDTQFMIDVKSICTDHSTKGGKKGLFGKGKKKDFVPITLIFNCPHGTLQKFQWLDIAYRMELLEFVSDRAEALWQSAYNEAKSRLATAPFIVAVMKRKMMLRKKSKVAEKFRRMFGKDPVKSIKELKVQPYYAYPNVVMTEADLHEEMLKPSENIQDFVADKSLDSSCTIGKVFVEVLGCVGLPNIDRIGNVSDPKCYFICGPNAFETDTIENVLNPMWPAKSKRAAVFPLCSVHSKVYVGVFDHNYGKRNDIMFGRVVLEMHSLRPDCTYDVTIPLRMSASIYNTAPLGVIRLRFRLEWFSQRSAVISSLRGLLKDQPHVIPIGDPLSFRNIAYTVYGYPLPGKFHTMALKSNLRELSLYSFHIKYGVKAFVDDMIAWRDKFVSLYNFSGYMYCVYFDAISYIFSFLVGFLILQMMRNYFSHLKRETAYKSPTITEIMKALVLGSKFEPLDLKKGYNNKNSSDLYEDANNDVDNVYDKDDADENIQNSEFPCSSSNYPKRLAVQSVFLSSKKKSNLRMSKRQQMSAKTQFRLSMVDMGNIHGVTPQIDEEIFDEAQILKQDDENEEEDSEVNWLQNKIAGVNTSASNKDMDGMDFILDDVPLELSTPNEYGEVEPYQDLTKSKKSKPFAEKLKKYEQVLKHLTGNRLSEMVYARNDESGEVDEFDRKIGLYIPPSMPIEKVKYEFLGPVMRMQDIFVCLFRSGFNIFAWKDPFLSFWVIVILSMIGVGNLLIPWKQLFLGFGIAVLGPQNSFLYPLYKKYKRAKKDKAASVLEKQLSVETAAEGVSTETDPLLNKKKYTYSFQPKKKKLQSEEEMDAHKSSSFIGNNYESRATEGIIKNLNVPHTALKRSRFYDWPPDPSVSCVYLESPFTIKKGK